MFAVQNPPMSAFQTPTIMQAALSTEVVEVKVHTTVPRTTELRHRKRTTLLLCLRLRPGGNTHAQFVVIQYQHQGIVVLMANNTALKLQNSTKRMAGKTVCPEE